jgi:hypothetical protein
MHNTDGLNSTYVENKMLIEESYMGTEIEYKNGLLLAKQH